MGKNYIQTIYVYTKKEIDALLGYKQDKLIAGNHITIVDNVISVDSISDNPATSSTYGSVKLGTDTIIDSIKSKVYPIGFNNDGQLYVEVPWENTTYDLSNYVQYETFDNKGIYVGNDADSSSYIQIFADRLTYKEPSGIPVYILYSEIATKDYVEENSQGRINGIQINSVKQITYDSGMGAQVEYSGGALEVTDRSGEYTQSISSIVNIPLVASDGLIIDASEDTKTIVVKAEVATSDDINNLFN